MEHSRRNRAGRFGDRRLAVFAMAWIGTPAGALASDGICVSCTGPSATYSCQLPIEINASTNRFARKGMRFACISEIARTNGHRACGVRKGARGPCIGDTYVLASPAQASVEPTAQPATAPATERGSAQPSGKPSSPASRQNGESIKAGKLAPDDPRAQAKQAKDADAPPETVAELAKDAVKTSTKQLKNAGDAVTGTLEKSWDCVSSLFTKCF